MNITTIRKRALEASSALNALALVGLAATASVALPTIAAAQDIATAQLSGTVSDEAGNAVPGATVTITANTRAIERTATTGASGNFTFVGLPLGTYDIVVSAPGYSTTRVTGADAALGGAAYGITLSSEATASGNEIIVTGARARVVDFSQAATGTVISVQELAKRVPVGRSLEALAMTTPSVTLGDPDPNLGNQSIAISGSSIAENIYYVNGMNITNFRTFVGGSEVPFEFYDQLQVKTGGYQAEFGRSTGGAVIAVTRSGSDEWKGGFNVFWEPDSLRSDQPDTYTADNDRDEVENIEGNVYLSGPIIPNMLYAFGFFNPRNYRSFGATRPDVSTSYSESTFTQKDPFWGGKVDFIPLDGHRFEFTYFNDTTNEVNDFKSFTSATGELRSQSTTTDSQGGENMIARYTGNMTDWLTVSGLYGKSKYNRTVSGTADGDVYTVDRTSGTAVLLQGSPNALVESGRDQRELYRVDVDLAFDLLGQHKVRMGWDREHLTASALSQYSGGLARVFYTATATEEADFGIPVGNVFYEEYDYRSGGTFKNRNTAFYIQDNWDVTDQLQLSLGIRNDRFENFTATGAHFFDSKNNWAPRLGATFDVFGDRRTKLSAFFGRYYLPIAANTNIRYAGSEYFTFSIKELSNGNLLDPTGVEKYFEVYSDTTNSGVNADELRSKNIKPQYMDEFIIGGEHRFGDNWKVGVNLIHRNLKKVIEDTDATLYAMEQYCADKTYTLCNATKTPTVGSGGYILLNPGSSAIFDYDLDGDGVNEEVVLTPEMLDLPKASRKYWGVEASFDRAWDEKWSLGGSYTWSKTRGNYEGGVNSDFDQDDVGLTQDFDEPGWADGSYGYLANDRRHVFKLNGAYSIVPGLVVSGNGRLGSPKRYSCFGNYPFSDGRAVTNSNNSYYCFGELTPRGTAFKGAWEKTVDLGVAYTLENLGISSVQFRVDVFNVFNFKEGIEYIQDAQLNSAAPDPNYRQIQYYQSPRRVRLGLSVDF